MFGEKEARSVSIAGGKGASLALLSSIKESHFDEISVNFLVPQGFIVSVSAFDLQVGRNSILDKLIKGVRGVAYGTVDGKLQDVCERYGEKLYYKFDPVAVFSPLMKYLNLSLQNRR